MGNIQADLTSKHGERTSLTERARAAAETWLLDPRHPLRTYLAEDVIEPFGLTKHADSLRQVMVEAEIAYWRQRLRPRLTVRLLRSEKLALERALKVLKTRGFETGLAADEPQTPEQIFGDAPRPTPVWELQAGLRHEIQRIDADLRPNRRGSAKRRDDLRAAAAVLRVFWVKAAKRNPNISSRGHGKLSKTGQFLLAALRLIDSSVTPSLILALDKKVQG